MTSKHFATMERAAQNHAAEWLRYAGSKQYAIDLANEKVSRAALDVAAGHSPKCGLTKCHPSCKREAV